MRNAGLKSYRQDSLTEHLIKDLSSLFGERIVFVEDEDGQRELRTKYGLFTLVIFTVGQRHLISTHLSEYFNKQSDCPLQFIVETGRPIKDIDRIKAAISFLRKHQKEEHYYSLPGFEDLDSSHYQSFLLEWKAKLNEES